MHGSNFLQNFYTLFPFILDPVNSVSVNMFHFPRFWKEKNRAQMKLMVYNFFPFTLDFINSVSVTMFHFPHYWKEKNRAQMKLMVTSYKANVCVYIYIYI